MNTQEYGLVVTVDDKGEPVDVKFNGKSEFINSIDIHYEGGKPPTVNVEWYVRDISGHSLITRHADGDPVLQRSKLYAVTKEDFELLQATKAAAKVAQ